MKVRPTSVTVIAWILVAMGTISLIHGVLALIPAFPFNFNSPVAKELMARSPIPIPVQYAMLYAGALMTLVSGIALLKGQNWARFLYVIWSVITSLVNIATSPLKVVMIPGVVLFVVIACFLFLPKANRYFAGSEVAGAAESH